VSLSGVVFTLAFLAAAGLIWGASKPGAGRRVSGGRIAAGAALPLLLLASCLAIATLHGRFGEFRLSMDRIEGDAVSQPLRIGGDRAADDVVTSGLRPALVTVEGAGDGETATGPRLSVAAPAAGQAVEVAAIDRGPLRPLDVIGSAPISPGEAICLVDCAEDGARWYLLRGSGRLDPARIEGGRIVATDEGVQPPRRRVAVVISGAALWTPVQAIHPLRDFLPPEDGARGRVEGCGSTIYCETVRGRPAPSAGFLFQDGGPWVFGGGQWRLFLPSAEARIARRSGGELQVRPARGDFTRPLKPDEVQSLAIFQARFASGPTGPNERRGRLVERRSLDVSIDRRGVAALRLHTPDTVIIGQCPRNGWLDVADVLTARDAPGARVVGLPALGGASGAIAEGVLPVPEAGRCAGFTSGWIQRGDVGVDGRQVTLRLERFSFPWIALAVAFGWAVLSWRAQARLLGERPVAWSLLLALQMLLAVRLLVGVSGAAGDTTIDTGRILADNLAAYVAAPLLFLAWSRTGRAPAWVWGAMLLFGALAFWGVEVAAQRPTGLALLLALAAGAAAAFHLLLAWPPFLKGMVRLRDASRSAAAVGSPGLVDAFAKPPLAWIRRYPWAALLAAAVLFRIVLMAFGVKERLVVALSAVYTPLLIAGFAGMVLWIAQRPVPPGLTGRPSGAAAFFRAAAAWANRRFWFWAFLAAILVVVLVIPAMVNDIGYALTMVGPLLALGAWKLGSGRTDYPLRRTWSLAAGLLIIAVVGPLLLGGVAALRSSPASVEAAARADDNGPALEILASAVDVQDNDARRWHVLDPEGLASAGASSTENLRVLSAYLSDYTAPVLGRGYLVSAPLGAIVRDVHLSDNVSAVHLMSSFGRVSAAAYLGLLAVLFAACARMTGQGRMDSRPWRRLIGLTSLTVLFGVAAYIILANLQLVLFTGRNVFLMAADSQSDLLEGLILFGLAWWGLTWNEEARDAA